MPETTRKKTDDQISTKKAFAPKKRIRATAKKPVETTEANSTDAARKEILEIIRQEGETQSQTAGKPAQAEQKPAPVAKMPASPPASFAATPPPQTTKSGSGKKIGLFVLALFIVLLVGVGVFAVGLYQYHWNDSVTRGVVKVVPFPAAIVKGATIRYSDYFHDNDALRQYYQTQHELNPDLVTIPSDEAMRGLIVEKLIRDTLLRREARAAGVTVSEEELNVELQKILEDSGGEQALEQSLQELYNWTIDDFKNSILEVFILREKMQDHLSNDSSLAYNQEAQQRAQEAFDKIQSGGEFESIAAEYSEDVTASQGGDLGFMGRDDLDEEFSKAAFSLDEGGVSDIVQTKYGYHIIKVDEKVKGADSESVEGSGEEEERIRVRHILIRTKDLDSWLNEQLDDHKVYNFIE
ncbi:MAG: peptidylprolyl isomerase [bacterium]|nr:peptidylprolyl isomerase [bacterium]